ncbi:MAG TPA: hypothetical protein VHM01_15215 [Alphaproteobacteria bacterium]|nr:hypothetical protein [Alphaproteobacteria bacterium]
MLWYARFHLLDDALIHLRLAELLLTHGFVTTNGQAVSFGTSSPVFLLLTAGLHAAIESDLTTKAISVAAYLTFVAGLVALAWRSAALERAWWLALALATLSPMGIRWLSDGMETSLSALLALALGITAIRAETRGSLDALWLWLLAAAIVGTRVEAILLVLVASATMAARSNLRGAAALAAGGATGLTILWAIFGSILPDPALAKATGLAMPAASLAGFATSLAGGMGFAVGLLALWLAGAAINFRTRSAARAVILLPNLALLALWCIVAARGQFVQGIRHLLAPLVFMIAANAALLRAVDFRDLRARVATAPRQALAWTVAGVIGLGFTAELVKFHAIVESRTAAFLEMRALQLAALEDAEGIAWDVGHLMYFTKAQVCDVSGVVNGRQAAMAPESQRLANCLQRDVEFVFVTPDNAAELIERSGSRFADWPVCGQYLFQNVSTTSPHFLAVAPARAAQICPRLRGDGSLIRATAQTM